MVSELLSKIPVLGLKIDKHTLESVSPNKARICMRQVRYLLCFSRFSSYQPLT